MSTNFIVRGQKIFIDFPKVVVSLVLHSSRISYKINGKGDLPTWFNTMQDLRLKQMAVSTTHVSQKPFHVILRFFTVFKTFA